MYADFFDKIWDLFLGKVKSAPSDFENRKKELQKSQKKMHCDLYSLNNEKYDEKK